MAKINDIKVGESIEFIFLDSTYTGEVIQINKKENNLRIKKKDGIVHVVSFDSKDNKFCYLK